MSSAAPTFVDLEPAANDPQANAEFVTHCLGTAIDALGDMRRDFRARRYVEDQRPALVKAYQNLAQLLEDLEN